MSSDKSNKSSNGHKHSTRSKKLANDSYKLNESSESDPEEDKQSDTEKDEQSDSEEDIKNIDTKEYFKLLGKLFPSKYMKRKMQALKSLKPVKTTENAKIKKKIFEILRENNTSVGDDDDSDEDYEDEGDDDDDDDDEYDEEEEYNDEEECEEEDEECDNIKALLKSALGKINIIVTMNDNKCDEYSESEYDSEEDDSEEDDSQEDDSQEDDSDECKSRKCKSRKYKSIKYKSRKMETCKGKTCIDESNKDESNKDETCNDETINKIKDLIGSLDDTDKKNQIIKGMINGIKEHEQMNKKKEDSKIKKIKYKNTKYFRELLKDNNVMNDVKFFQDKMDIDEQSKIITQIKEIKKQCNVNKPYRLALLDTDIPVAFKACAFKKINALKHMESGCGEYYKIKQWVDAFMQIPFGINKTLSITMDDGIDKCHDFMNNAKSVLDEAVFGLNDAKLQIMQMLGQWIVNPLAIGSSIAIKGPMGTGKTTLVKDGISKILGRDFAFIALGGATDSSFLEGHGYTYEGSMWGKIVDVLIQNKTMNPVFYFDELDKVSDTPKGEEIIGILTHLTDTTQSDKFHDKYFSEIDFDLSKCLFIFSYNDESRVNPILLDRMYRIQTKGYDVKEKLTIVKKYLLPKIREQVKFNEGDVIIPDDIITYLINTHTGEEQGVRNLKRCLEYVHTNLNIYRLMKPGTFLFEKEHQLEITFPMTVTIKVIDTLFKKDKDNASLQYMYM